jgi:hypothetical protein
MSTTSCWLGNGVLRDILLHEEFDSSKDKYDIENFFPGEVPDFECPEASSNRKGPGRLLQV